MPTPTPGPSGEYCLRCKDVELDLLPESSPRITFYACSNCNRHYAKQPEESLHDRWLSPLSIVLYPVIFVPKPQLHAQKAAEGFFHHGDYSEEWLKRVLSDIENELETPTQKVREILELEATEEDLREYLELFRRELKALLAKDS
jgi:hypothetical protein